MARPRSFDETKVLSSAREEFWNRGYAATRLEDLVSATGLGKGSLYGAFGDKRRLFLNLLNSYCHQQLSDVQRTLTAPGTAMERLTRLFEHVVHGYTGDAGRRGCFMVNSTSELHGQDPDVAALARATCQRMEDLLVTCVKDAQREGEVDASADPQELGRLLLAALQGIEFLAKTGMDDSALRQIGHATLRQLPGA
ncbi:TetR/AcrR family transcriptional regulator [Streptomyces cynarae]|uniref:TetR/AcrR family transcriptional regulator n=1 Tax=Streptomyces cynarae TaxID=2981134 RepID=A0ABY6EAW9_9ACTN|nr:TetR/AcrR family transcriptional regulator [Streptomyces cynarae]UXY23809.1 TetR/AcrR family transcriptional regulator [Streptomyces cynarae]